ncbi:hypothetical protein BV210_07465 [Halorientalis sp. IM1011]|uniref:hypothetical protein n=1 Tax=Halorientalis sp. IM1011 TaxID=1932360 RepID=UPI00097CC861|nr:hypothetical protein [Halorientalis sp. IM1011]AQL42556.1 hypothetical protein BV210_07465 [Halorientalis sp. IM1011]
MDEKYERGILRISVVFLLAAVLLIPVGYAGIGASPILPVGFAVLAAGLYVAWQRSDEYGAYLSGLWLGPVLAAVVAIAGFLIGATPGELQALGGIVGIVGVFNLILRPVYRAVHYVVAGALQIGREIQEERSS